MNYETALALKKAGFPQFKEDGSLKGHYLFPEGVTLADKEMAYKAAFVPTLEELIEECEHFRTLEKIDGKWWADAWNTDTRKKLGQESGSTPKIAVVNLYLALNKSK